MIDIEESASAGPQQSYVVAGAKLSCIFGSKQVRLTMPLSHGVYIKGKAQMNIQDFAPMLNILPFGTCMSPTSNGVPCVPIIATPWIGGKMDTLVEGKPALLNTCTNTCLRCGLIKIDDDGQE